MKRLLLLAPVLALLLMACPAKHMTQEQLDHMSETAPPPPDNSNSNSGGNGSGGITVISTQNPSSNNDTVVTNVSMPNTQTAPDTSLPRLVVSFISIGQGTDHDARAKLDKWLTKNPHVKYEVIHWGREGEVDYRFDIKNLTPAAQNSVVTDVRVLIGNNDLVLIKEWSAAHQGRAVVAEEAPAVAVDSNIVRLVVSFISKGEGIDYKTEESFKAWLAERPQFTYEVTHWGREGEVNYCFRMSNIDGRQQEVFVRDVRTFMTDKELVIVSEWAKCDRRK